MKNTVIFIYYNQTIIIYIKIGRKKPPARSI